MGWGHAKAKLGSFEGQMALEKDIIHRCNMIIISRNNKQAFIPVKKGWKGHYSR